MRAIWTGSINFGLMNIPIKLYSGSENHTLDLDLLRRKDLCPIRFARVCRSDGKEVPWKDIVRGYEYKDGNYVVLEKEDFEQANIEKTNSIEITSFVQEDEVDSIFYEKPYYLEPQKSSMKAYALLREALKKTKMVGIANFVIRHREHIGVVKPYEDIIVLDQLRYHAEVRSYKDLNLPEKNLVKQKELSMAQQLIKNLSSKFKPKDYTDTYIKDLKKIITAKAKGKKLKKVKQEPSKESVTDIMSLLKKSLSKSKKSAA